VSIPSDASEHEIVVGDRHAFSLVCQAPGHMLWLSLGDEAPTSVRTARVVITDPTVGTFYGVVDPGAHTGWTFGDYIDVQMVGSWVGARITVEEAGMEAGMCQFAVTSS
jgi:hypothetical protein